MLSDLTYVNVVNRECNYITLSFGLIEEGSIFTFEVPNKRDGKEVYQLIKSCPPLDVNSKYAYFLLCDHFADSSIIVRDTANSDKIVGFIGGYRKPNEPETLFVWQIAVSEECRGQKLSHMMLERLLQVHNPVTIENVEATFTPSNKASYHFFNNFGTAKGGQVVVDDYLDESDFAEGSSTHEAEKRIKLYQINTSVVSKTKAE